MEILFADVQNVNSLDGKSSFSEHTGMIHYLENKVGVVDFANAQGMVMF